MPNSQRERGLVLFTRTACSQALQAGIRMIAGCPAENDRAG
jgi:hypothetical protein